LLVLLGVASGMPYAHADNAAAPAANSSPSSAPPPSAPLPSAPRSASNSPPPGAATTKASSSGGASSKSPASAAGKLAASDTASGSYLRMKKAQIMGVASDDPNAKPQPVIDMLIPATWDMKGEQRPNGGRSGCLCDAFAILWEARSADGTTVFRGIPDYSWQYSDDPQQLQKLNDPHRRTRDGAGKIMGTG
jgi:hypothetical protein